MDTVNVLNIPNFYVSYYLYGLNKEFKIRFIKDNRFLKYNNKPILIFKVHDKIVIIDNDDPVAIVKELYAVCHVYFVTNKLINHKSYQQEKVLPLFPHYPINIIKTYLRIYNLNLIKYLKLKSLLKELYTLLRRPVYKEYKFKKNENNFIFFSSNLWKKEVETNLIRAAFIRFCKSDKRVVFEGGFVPRSDGENQGYDEELNIKKYTPRTFSKLSAKTKVALNNPAVCGAVSWRLAEYLNQGVFVLSFPFKIELPVDLLDNKEVCYINKSNDFKCVFDKIFLEQDYHYNISKNGQMYFREYCTPKAQIAYMLKNII